MVKQWYVKYQDFAFNVQQFVTKGLKITNPAKSWISQNYQRHRSVRVCVYVGLVAWNKFDLIWYTL